MADNIDKFWELFEAVAGGTGTGITTVQNSLAKSDRTKLETYFTQVIDQISFSTIDYNRLRKFLIDLFATHRTLSTLSLSTSDPHTLTNSDLDELFRSFGYPHSTQLRGFDENPLEQKVQFFLDLVNLYKVKGTPQSLVDVLQYYGVTEVDIYEFLLKLDAPNSLIFEGKAVAGTTIDPSIINVPFTNITESDPHWLYTSSQILQLNNQLKINLPSKTPYIGVQPVVDLEGAEFSYIQRIIQDQHDSWISGTDPPANAEISYVGEVRSFLELYLCSIYMFNKIFDVGVEANRFMCYDGTSTDILEIVDEFETITDPPIRRCDLNDNDYVWTDSTSGIIVPGSYCADSKLVQYYDQFTRPTSSNFLVDENSAGDILAVMDPAVKASLDAAANPIEVLFSLLKDMALWVRANIGFGFLNFGFILFGIQAFFSELKPVIEFFKPYRARLLLLEALLIRNRLFNTIVVDDAASLDVELPIHDFLTGDSIPCCAPSSDIDSTSGTCVDLLHPECKREFSGAIQDVMWEGYWSLDTVYAINDLVASGIEGNYYICTQAHTSNAATKPGFGSGWSIYWNLYSYIGCDSTSSLGGVSVHSRDFYDCGSYHDIGAVTDIPEELFVEVTQIPEDHLRCPSYGPAAVTSEIVSITDSTSYIIYTTQLNNGSSSVVINFADQLSSDYAVFASLRNESTPTSIYNYIITNKTSSTFTLDFSSPMDSTNYYLDWAIYQDSTTCNTTSLTSGNSKVTIPLDVTYSSTNYDIALTMKNTIDSIPSKYGWIIVDKTTSSFAVQFSDIIDSTNYSIEWGTSPGDDGGTYSIPNGSTTVTVPIIPSFSSDEYSLLVSMENTDSTSSVYSWIVTEKTQTDFTLEFSSPIDSTSYIISWSVESGSVVASTMVYYQSGGFRDFDDNGTFDCTHGFDLVKIIVESGVEGNLLLEDGDLLLTEASEFIEL